jgi:hypothetical protein
LVSVDLLYALFDPVVAPLDLIVESGDFSFEDITVSLLAVVAHLLVAVGARVDVGLLRADVATGHDGVRVRVRQFA